MDAEGLKAPFPYMGGKSQAAHLIWRALGDVTNFVEPFAGSAATLLARPTPFSGTETINDENGYVANFWRSVSKDADAVAAHADYPVLENDVHARHKWLWERRDDLAARLEADPEWFDPKIAGWWVWGMSCFVPGAWCVDQPRRCKPECAGHFHGKGVHGTSRSVLEWMRDLMARLRRVRVLCGDYKRALTNVVLSASKIPTGKIGVFLDPPYAHKGRDAHCYGKHDNPDVFAEAVQWSIAHANEDTRIVIAGYDSMPMPDGWKQIAWKSHGGLGRRVGNENNSRERLLLSPACLDPADHAPRQRSLFGGDR